MMTMTHRAMKLAYFFPIAAERAKNLRETYFNRIHILKLQNLRVATAILEICIIIFCFGRKRVYFTIPYRGDSMDGL